MRTVADLHTHTSVSQHAYSSLDEMARSAAELGLAAIGITDHGPGMMDGAIRHHFYCMRGLPKAVHGLRLVAGAEVNIKDFDGGLDLDRDVLRQLDFVVASYHVEAIDPAASEQHTRGWLNVIANPDVDCLGHCGNPVFACDYEAVVKACREHGKAVEINSSSFKVRPGSSETCRAVALLCKEYGVPVLISSDAHSRYLVGDHQAAIRLLESVGFPEELVINGEKGRLMNYLDWLEQGKAL
ncbi:phosphatase [Enterocloster asparagiformis]|uniref:Phosphatase n=1 Tax=Enterocloster asparagiformis TaxID=333367 RepID=A0A413FH32_9FIRM|nr:phosphatase [Enterocloster asparagiformis]